jgi:NAD(P)-dependent dehydrogenase (short-subunit alcohol dehydrogenase family)
MTTADSSGEDMSVAEYDLRGTVAFVTGAGLVPAPGGADLTTALTDEEIRFILDVNPIAGLYCTRAVGSHMLLRGSGKVINIGSFASARGGGALTIYSAVKTALVGFTRVQHAQRVVPLRREGRLREVGLVALYLASRASDYMTGQTPYLDGGLTL